MINSFLQIGHLFKKLQRLPLELVSFSRAAAQDIVNRYANDRMAQKYNNAVTMVRTVLSVGPNEECIFSMEIGI